MPIPVDADDVKPLGPAEMDVEQEVGDSDTEDEYHEPDPLPIIRRVIIPFDGQLNTAEKVYGDMVEIEGYKWRPLVMVPDDTNLSLYIDTYKAEELPNGWYRKAKYCIRLLHPEDPTLSKSMVGENEFGERVRDWGFRQFLPIRDVLELGYVADGNLHVELEAHVIDDGVRSRFDPRFADSKATTGYVGLKNQGATCYMNSLLQVLFHTGEFRRIVYQIPTAGDKEEKVSLALALQRLFYRLQVSSNPVSTKELTKSFGWNDSDAFLQHDVQELSRVLIDKIEEKMKGTEQEGSIQSLFRGKFTSFIKCINIDYESSRQEDFYDLSLNVKGCKDLRESFEQYVEVERLEGDNKYHAEGHGLQDAEKGVIFDSFPPILHLQLKRFEFDPVRFVNYKVNDRYQFPKRLELDPKLFSSKADPNVDRSYELHAVLVHSGNVHGGHYYAYVRPTLSDDWLQFDDDKVSQVTEKEAIEMHFGGEVVKRYNINGRIHTQACNSYASAYMLVYIRSREAQSIIAQEPKEDSIPQHLQEQFDREQQEEIEKERERAEAHLKTSVVVVRAKDLHEHNVEQFDLVSMNSMKPRKVRKDLTVREFKTVIEETEGIPVQQQRLWGWVNRQNKTCRPTKIYTEEMLEEKLETYIKQHKVKFFVEEAELSGGLVETQQEPNGDAMAEEATLPVLEEDVSALIFVKYFDVDKRTLHYVGYRILPTNVRPALLLPTLRAMISADPNLPQIPLDVPLDVYEEVKSTFLEQVDMEKTLGESEIQSGDILIVQRATAAGEQSVPSYYQYLLDRVFATVHVIQFPILLKKEDKQDDSFQVELNKNMDYEQVAEAVSSAIDVPPNRIRFYHQDPAKFRNRKVHSRQDRPRLNDLGLSHGQFSYPASYVLWVEKLDMDIEEVEQCLQMNIVWQNRKGEAMSKHSIIVPRGASISDVKDKLLNEIEDDKVDTVRLMLLKSGGHQISSILSDQLPVNRLSSAPYDEYVAEAQTSSESQKMQAGGMLVYAFHYEKTVNWPFGNPCSFVIEENETSTSLIQKVKDRFEISDVEFTHWRVCVQEIGQRTHELTDDDTPLYEIFSTRSCEIGLQHVDFKRSNKLRKLEKGVVIC